MVNKGATVIEKLERLSRRFKSDSSIAEEMQKYGNTFKSDSLKKFYALNEKLNKGFKPPLSHDHAVMLAAG